MASMNNKSKPIKTPHKSNASLKRIYIDGSGARPDGKGSAFAYCVEGSGEKNVEHCEGLTNNQAEYRAFLSAITSIPARSRIEILTDSQIVAYQFNGRFKINEPPLYELLLTIRGVIHKKDLEVTVTWIRRQQNLAGKLL
jgi:ribonuclease HI